MATEENAEKNITSPTEEKAVLTDAHEPVQVDEYEPIDIFEWANNLVQYVDDLKIELYFFSKKFVPYRTKLSGDVYRQLRPLFLDEILEYVLGGIEKGLVVRGFEEAESEENVLQRTKVDNVDKLIEVLNFLKTQNNVIETFSDDDHDIKRMKGVIAYCTHKSMQRPFYLIKSLPSSQVMKGHTAWILKGDTFTPFDNMSALKIPGENQLLVIGKDLFVFNQAKLKSLFGYDAKAASIARQKVAQIEANFQLSFAEGITMQSLVKGRPATIKKLQKIEPTLVKQEELINHADEIGVDLMVDNDGSIIIMDEKDLTKFVNLLNDDYIESPMTGQRYEIIKKRPLKPSDEDSLLKELPQ
jgi:hypothetical protein